MISYNVLANCYSDSEASHKAFFSACPREYLDFQYRRLLLVHEIQSNFVTTKILTKLNGYNILIIFTLIDYKADIIFLQECESKFLETDLKSSMPNYYSLLKTKVNSNEGCGTLFRKDRFKYIKSHDINFINELTSNPLFRKLWQNCNSNIKTKLTERIQILQVTQVESIDFPGMNFLTIITSYCLFKVY